MPSPTYKKTFMEGFARDNDYWMQTVYLHLRICDGEVEQFSTTNLYDSDVWAPSMILNILHVFSMHRTYISAFKNQGFIEQPHDSEKIYVLQTKVNSDGLSIIRREGYSRFFRGPNMSQIVEGLTILLRELVDDIEKHRELFGDTTFTKSNGKSEDILHNLQRYLRVCVYSKEIKDIDNYKSTFVRLNSEYFSPDLN